MRRIALIAIALVTCGFPGASQAQWHLQIEGGASILLNVLSVNRELEINSDDEAGGLFGAGFGYELGEYFEPTVNIRGGFTPLDVGILDTLTLVTVTAGGKLYPLGNRRFRPWLGAEIGLYHTDVDVERVFASDLEAEDDSFGYNVGGGLAYRLSDLISLGADVRYHRADASAIGDLELVSFLATLGFHFGGEAPPR